MTRISRAALLLALAFFLAPFAAAEGEEPAEEASSSDGGSEPAPEGGGSEPAPEENATSSGPVEEIEDCLCNGTGNETEPAPDPIQDRAACAPAEIDVTSEVHDYVEVDPDGCYRSAIRKAVQDQPAVIRNVVCMIVELLP